MLNTRKVLSLVLLATLAGSPAHAQDGSVVRKDRIEAQPTAVENLTISEKPDQQLPAALPFLDDHGREVTLGDYFNQGKPIILTLNYYRCPMLCEVTLKGMVDGLRASGLQVGRDYEVVTVSFDALETPKLAAAKKKSYVEYWDDPAALDGWHFLTGEQRQIDTLTTLTGFQYRWVEARKEYAHPAVIMVATPEGKLSRYLYGVRYDPQTLRLTLVDASEGKIGTPMDQILLFCFHYDSAAGRYAPVAFNIMRLGGAITVVLLFFALGMLWLAERKRRGGGGSRSAPPTVLGEINV